MTKFGSIGENGGMTLDMTEVNKNIFKLAADVPGLIDQGLFAAGERLKLDAIEIEPTAPKDKGDLRKYTEISPVNQGDVHAVQVAFLQPYAARWHEAEGDIDPVTGSKITWTTTGSGPKYLEIKMVRYMKKYFDGVADYIRRRLGT